MKKAVGFYMTILSTLAGTLAFAAYLVNCRTDYFVGLGVSPFVVGCLILAIAIQIAYLVLTKNGHKLWIDILAVLPPILLIEAVVTLISSRVNSFAAILSFENNAKNMADMTSAIVGIAACVIAALIGVLASFFDVVKEKPKK